MSISRHIPNVFTSLNLLSGCVGIVSVMSGRLEYGAYFLWLGGLFDFLDGFVARLLKVNSPIGKEYDSLADMITFGALPSFLVYKLLEDQPDYIAYLAFVIAVFSALRLAKFNIDTTQKEVFVGMPTPANALFITGLVFSSHNYIGEYLMTYPVILFVSVLFSLAMVSPIKFIALKFSGLSWSGNELKFVLLIGAVGIIGALGFQAVSLVVIWYVILSLAGNLFGKFEP